LRFVNASRGRPPGGPSTVLARAVVAAFILLTASVSGVAAHGGFPGLIAEPNPINPGGTIEIRGDNLGSDEAVSIVLIAGGEQIALVSTTTDGEGHLDMFATVPADLPAARYTLQAQSEGGYVAGGSVELTGAPISDQGGGDPYERGPIASVPAVQAPPGGQAVPGSVPIAQPTAASDALILVAALVLPLAVVLGMVGWRRRALARR
jgi:hypothetical protein